jgi:hypothetical protein
MRLREINDRLGVTVQYQLAVIAAKPRCQARTCLEPTDST